MAGRSLRWPAIGFSLFASNISSTHHLHRAYRRGVCGQFVRVELRMDGGRRSCVHDIHLHPHLFARTKISTIPGILGASFWAFVETILLCLTIFTSVFVDTAGALYAGAVVLKAFFPELDLGYTCMVLAVVAGLYTRCWRACRGLSTRT